MKKLLLVLIMMFICTTASADNFTQLDKEAVTITKPFLKMLTDVWKESGYTIVSTGARSITITETDDIVYLAYVETSEGFYWYEFTIKSVNGNKGLCTKYGIGDKE